LAEPLPTLWHHPAVKPEQRKVLVGVLIQTISITPTPGCWTVAIAWKGGRETRHRLLTARGIRDLVAQACEEGLSPDQIADRLGHEQAIRRLGSRAGQVYSRQAVRDLMRHARLERPIDGRAYEHIQTRLAAYTPYPTILAELNREGLTHPLGSWTKSRLQTAIERLRGGRVQGIPAVPPPGSLKAVVLTLHETGATIPTIVEQLNTAGLKTLQGRPVTYTYVWQILRQQGQHPHRIAQQVAFNGWLAQWAPQLTLRALVARANELGFVTRAGKAWTAATLERKLLARGLPVGVASSEGGEEPA
jgi:hypothetical protein